MIIEYEDWQLRPFSNGLCWQLYEFRTVNRGKENQRNDWVALDCYPTTIGGGLETIYEFALKANEDGEGYDTTDLKNAIKEAKAIKTALLKAVKSGNE